MTTEQEAELDDLKRKLKAREKVSGWVQNCIAIRKRIAEIENDAD